MGLRMKVDDAQYSELSQRVSSPVRLRRRSRGSPLRIRCLARDVDELYAYVLCPACFKQHHVIRHQARLSRLSRAEDHMDPRV